ncbi:hypothetical protein BG011_007772 [Mortierella polycephala]|uniref:Uncharacterized protein n=1 Tax=Mortierella polycephala TaxID=41804 RepID=A0A9P6QA03_9FUNG|nr:hypothetical protein BG011_007772 [Mortierella polycephala]
MQIKISALLAALMVVTLTVQTAPTPISTTEAVTAPTPAPNGEGEGGSSGSAGAIEVAYTVEDPETKKKVESGSAIQSSQDERLPLSANALQCWDEYRSGRVYALTCSGSRWYEWTDCSNGYRYTIGPFGGTLRGVIVCPLGTYSQRGGAFGY